MIFNTVMRALPGVLGNRGTRAIFSGEGTGKHRPKNKGNRATQAI